MVLVAVNVTGTPEQTVDPVTTGFVIAMEILGATGILTVTLMVLLVALLAE